eukprot:TRINITY_DN2087_c1_g1_i1.p1 TRINITY_DN2087_c1_g1~~TRINITY_DN2087_c1_g1_i1.p1  ORF type:complete len:655 (+),score=160.78 TRINITY_DN2087_c1_g1_i1:295-2259(+)
MSQNLWSGTGVGADIDADRVVLQYLVKKGYKQAETLFRQEAKTQTLGEKATDSNVELSTTVANYILLYSSNEAPQSYEESYTKLRNWIHSSLDMYQQEMQNVLFPLYVHSYLDLVAKGHDMEASKFLQNHREEHNHKHAQEIQRLKSVTTPELMRENELVNIYRSLKFNIRMCSYALELLLSFLQDHKFMLLLSVLNQYTNLKVYFGQPQTLPDDQYLDVTSVTTDEDEVKSIDTKTVYWGTIPTYENAVEAERRKAADPKKASSSSKRAATAADANGPYPDKPLATPKPSEQLELDLINDVRKRVRLSANALPSVCCYTLLNTHDRLNCIDISDDGSMVCGGFADSVIKLWELNTHSRRPIFDTTSSSSGTNAGQDSVTRNKKTISPTGYQSLIGHSGPVYATSFSPDGQFLVSGSADSTARLWSMDTGSALVAYKGHTYPVWDVAFSPAGYYFVTASHDRTARLWSTDQPLPLRIFAGHFSDVDCVAWHPNGNYVATGSSDKTVRIWDVASGECMRILTGHTGAVYTIAISPDGKTIASGGDDNHIMLWDVGSGRRINRLSGHSGTIWSLSFSKEREGALLASGSADNTVRVWDINKNANNQVDSAAATLTSTSTNSPELLTSLPTKKTPIYKVKFSRRNLLFSGGAYARNE